MSAINDRDNGKKVQVVMYIYYFNNGACSNPSIAFAKVVALRVSRSVTMHPLNLLFLRRGRIFVRIQFNSLVKKEERSLLRTYIYTHT